MSCGVQERPRLVSGTDKNKAWHEKKSEIIVDSYRAGRDELNDVGLSS